jgi:hypothetical protein
MSTEFAKHDDRLMKAVESMGYGVVNMSDREIKKRECEKLANWMIDHGFATGHGDNMEDLLKELSWQVKELKDQLWSYRKEHASK